MNVPVATSTTTWSAAAVGPKGHAKTTLKSPWLGG